MLFLFVEKKTVALFIYESFKTMRVILYDILEQVER